MTTQNLKFLNSKLNDVIRDIDILYKEKIRIKKLIYESKLSEVKEECLALAERGMWEESYSLYRTAYPCSRKIAINEVRIWWYKSGLSENEVFEQPILEGIAQ